MSERGRFGKMGDIWRRMMPHRQSQEPQTQEKNKYDPTSLMGVAQSYGIHLTGDPIEEAVDRVTRSYRVAIGGLVACTPLERRTPKDVIKKILSELSHGALYHGALPPQEYGLAREEISQLKEALSVIAPRIFDYFAEDAEIGKSLQSKINTIINPSGRFPQ